MPNGDRAIVDDAKLFNYVLDPHHPVGRAHAELFERLMGITKRNHRDLKDAILKAAIDNDVIPGKQTPFGTKFEMRFPMTGP